MLRQRVLWAQAETNNHWAFTGGQMWSLATEDKKGLSNLSGDIMTPQTIDPNYNVGFVWTRQYGFRVTKTGKFASFGVAVENPQVLYTAALAGTRRMQCSAARAPTAATITLQSAPSHRLTYVTRTTRTVAGTTTYLPVYNTVTANTNIANYLVQLCTGPHLQACPRSRMGPLRDHWNRPLGS